MEDVCCFPWFPWRRSRLIAQLKQILNLFLGLEAPKHKNSSERFGGEKQEVKAEKIAKIYESAASITKQRHEKYM